MSPLGIVAGLATAALWSVTAVCFESASRRIGSLSVNVLRLLVAALLFLGLSMLRTGSLVPPGLLPSAWIGLSLSGIVGFVVGDLLLFQAFTLIGARLSMLIYASAPALIALGGYVFLGEGIGGQALVGMGITVLGIAMAIVGKPSGGSQMASSRWAGILLALGASAGQAGGLLLAKHGARGIDSFSATQVRVLAGLTGFLLVAAGARRLLPLIALLRTALFSSADSAAPRRTLREALAILSVGALLGPFLGVSLGLLSAQLLPAGVASTLMSLVPVLLIPIAALVFRERISFVEMVGTGVAFAGVVVMAI